MSIVTIIILVILVVSIIVLSYQVFSYKSKYELIKESLGKESVTLEGLLVKIKTAEAQQALSQAEIENNRKVIEDQKAKVQKLMDDVNTSNVSLDQKTKDLAYARKSIFEANDYILETHFGSNKESILRLRRLRDIILLNLHNFRRGGCKFIKSSEAYIKTMRILKYLQTNPPYSTAETPETKKAALVHAEQVYKGYDDKVKKYNEDIQKLNNDLKQQKIQSGDIKQTNSQVPVSVNMSVTIIYPQMSFDEEVARMVIEGNKYCNDPQARVNLNNQINNLRTVANSRTALFVDPTDWNALIDEIEKVFMAVYDKSCANNFPNYLILGNILQSLFDSFCQSTDADMSGMLNKPLDSALIKTSVLFL